MYWLEVSVQTDGEGAEAVAEVLRPFAYQGSVVLEQLGDETSLEPDAVQLEVTVKFYVPEDEDSPQLRRRLEEILYHMGRLYPLPAPRFREVADEDWANAWKDHYHPFRVGKRLRIRPTWVTAAEDTESRDDDLVMVLDPGMAFGTGLHPTTQSCLRALETAVTPGASVLDAGTGSGILAIAAARLGARRVAAFDTEPLAIAAVLENAAQNQVSDRIQAWQGELDSVETRTGKGAGAWDVVVANILAPVIIGLLDNDGLLGYVAPGGRLILSGIVSEQGPEVVAALNRGRGQVVEELVQGDWVTYAATPITEG